MQHEPLDVGVPAICCAQEVNDGPRDIFRKLALDLPDGLFSLVDIGLSGLDGDKIVDLGAAVMVVISLGMASVIFAEIKGSSTPIPVRFIPTE
jgi:hypothetical protein